MFLYEIERGRIVSFSVREEVTRVVKKQKKLPNKKRLRIEDKRVERNPYTMNICRKNSGEDLAGIYSGGGRCL
jgi:hypothetical protein